jgi:hypothetical protein
MNHWCYRLCRNLAYESHQHEKIRGGTSEVAEKNPGSDMEGNSQQ